jgi:xanthine dehydrogenase accessory factor
MKELGDILHAFDRARDAGVESALATVVRVEGSSYRSPGARMLMTADGQIVGGVSGGCLERDVIQRAAMVRATNRPIVVRYDTTPDFETGTGYSLGCGGVIDVLIEPLGTAGGLELMRLLRCFYTTAPGTLSTIIAPLNHPRLGEHKILSGSAIEPGDSAYLNGQATGGRAEVFVEHIRPPLKLIVFGAGNDVVPLASLGKAMGWQVIVVDVRSAPINLNQTWPVEHIRCTIDDVAGSIFIGDFTAAVVMTHNFDHDRKLIGWLALQPLVYLGLLGARHRTAELLSRLSEIPPQLHAPVGLDIGGTNPEEVALSIAAEITAVIRGRSHLSSNMSHRLMLERTCPVSGS